MGIACDIVVDGATECGGRSDVADVGGARICPPPPPPLPPPPTFVVAP